MTIPPNPLIDELAKHGYEAFAVAMVSYGMGHPREWWSLKHGEQMALIACANAIVAKLATTQARRLSAPPPQHSEDSNGDAD